MSSGDKRAGDFARLHDTFGNVLIVRPSKGERVPKVWVFCYRNPNHIGPEEASPCVNVAQARRLIRALERFVESATSPTSAGAGKRRRRGTRPR